jgi:anti-anti-sigma factor
MPEGPRQETVSRYAQPLSVERTEHGLTIVFHCRGAFSILNDLRLREFERAVAAAEAARVVLDFREVTYVDSRGLGALAACVKKAGTQSKELLLVSNPRVRDPICTTGLDKVLRLCDTLDDALR